MTTTETTTQPKVGIVLLNWNGWRDTIDCLESLTQLNYPNFTTYVVDNASSDGSENHLRAWDPALTVIQSGSNLGWAGGCNVGIRAALNTGCTHIYLLNNDAMVRPDTLSRLVDAAAAPEAAAVGSLVVSATDPGWVEFAGTVMDARTHHPRQISCKLAELPTPHQVSATIAVKGCSMLLTGHALKKIGLLAEDYFLNYDETDWCFRAREAGMTNYYVPTSIVAHKGAASFSGTYNPLYRYFVTRNRLLFARRHLDARGRFFAWRISLWEIRHALTAAKDSRPASLRHRLLLASSVLLAIRDHCLGRYGDCPSIVRHFARSYQSQ
jgi:GT2 family glycosyltransferase